MGFYLIPVKDKICECDLAICGYSYTFTLNYNYVIYH